MRQRQRETERERQRMRQRDEVRVGFKEQRVLYDSANLQSLR